MVDLPYHLLHKLSERTVADGVPADTARDAADAVVAAADLLFVAVVLGVDVVVDAAAAAEVAMPAAGMYLTGLHAELARRFLDLGRSEGHSAARQKDERTLSQSTRDGG